MTKIQKFFNMILGGVRIFMSGVFATIFIIILLPTIVTLAEVLSFGVWMLTYGNFYLLIGILTGIVSLAILLSKVVIPELPSGE